MSVAVGSNAYGLDADLFTGGAAKERGETMVQLHREKMQQEKENMALEKLSALLPQMGVAVLVAALKETDFEVEPAVTMLRAFNTELEDRLKTLHKKRSKLRQQMKEAEEEAMNESSSDDSSSGSSSGSSDSDSDSESDRKRKHSKKHKKEKGKRKRDKDDKRKKKKKKRSNKEGSNKNKGLTSGDNFGKYGIIRETDAAAKSSEFILWALEHKKVDIETLPKNDERELFKDYIEEYNTASLPHRKYYNLQSYENYKAAKRASRGLKAVDKKKSALDDEQELRQARAEEAARLRDQRLKEAFQELKHSDKAKDMKEQELLRLQAQAAYKTGDHATAAKIAARLLPDDQKPK